MSTIYPEGIIAQGNGAVWAVPALANINAPKLTELTAKILLSCGIRGFSPTGEQGSSTDPRYCSTQMFEVPGRYTPSIDPLEYVYDPQEPDNVAEYAYYTELTEGRSLFVINRLGLAYDLPPAAGQYVNVYPVVCGAKMDVPVDPGAEGTKIAVRQKLFISGPMVRDVALVA